MARLNLSALLLFFMAACTQLALVSSFVVAPSSSSATFGVAATHLTLSTTARGWGSIPPTGHCVAVTALHEKPSKVTSSKTDGSGRGLVLLGIVAVLCVWIFSIPPEFRRASFCPTQRCVETRCNDCVTFDEWTSGISDYYRNGGGIEFDFSIAQETKDFWEGK